MTRFQLVSSLTMIFYFWSPLSTAVQDHNPQDAHLHATIQKIDELANEDVEMQVSLFGLSVYVFEYTKSIWICHCTTAD